jgi:hypothetical protein
MGSFLRKLLAPRSFSHASVVPFHFYTWVFRNGQGRLRLGSRIGSTCFAFARERDLQRGADCWKFSVGEFFGLAE